MCVIRGERPWAALTAHGGVGRARMLFSTLDGLGRSRQRSTTDTAQSHRRQTAHGAAHRLAHRASRAAPRSAHFFSFIHSSFYDFRYTCSGFLGPKDKSRGWGPKNAIYLNVLFNFWGVPKRDSKSVKTQVGR